MYIQFALQQFMQRTMHQKLFWVTDNLARSYWMYRENLFIYLFFWISLTNDGLDFSTFLLY